jgi:release factor glutamine methyltransferase
LPDRVLELTGRAAPYLAKHGSTSPRLDAELLLAEVLHCNRMDLYMQFERPLTEAEVGHFRDLCRRRAGGEPMAYILGRKEFMSLDFTVNPSVLIPRPETEMLVEEGSRRLRESASPRLLDVGTGSGAIAVAMLAAHAGLTAVATDISAAALLVAAANAERHGVSARLELRETDLVAGVEGRFDLVAANLPYIDPTWEEATTPEVAASEPHVALFAGGSGLDLFRRLLPELPRLLCPGGCALLECDPRQADALLEMAAPFGRVTLSNDLGGRERLLVIET